MRIRNIKIAVLTSMVCIAFGCVPPGNNPPKTPEPENRNPAEPNRPAGVLAPTPADPAQDGPGNALPANPPRETTPPAIPPAELRREGPPSTTTKAEISWKLSPDTIANHWHLFGPNGINIKPAWEVTEGSPTVNIAIVDGEFSRNHAAFTSGDCRANYRSFDFFGLPPGSKIHGLPVTSVISTCPNNSKGIVGINANSSVTMLEWGGGSSRATDDLFIWAMGDKNICNLERESGQIKCDAPNSLPADIMNASFGSHSGDPRYRRTLLRTIKWINQQNGILVAASGNDSRSADKHFPAAATGVISVGATTNQGKAAGFSDWGETVEALAPGQFVNTAAENDTAKLSSGTSFASPIVAGVLSLMRSVYPGLNWKTSIYFLQSTATRMSCDEYCSDEYDNYKYRVTGDVRQACKEDCCVDGKQICTPGRVNAGEAVKAAKAAHELGLPAVALVDADRYFVDMARVGTAREGQFVIYNVGGASGKYIISSKDPELTFDKTEVELAPMGQPGDRATISVGGPSNLTREIAIRIASPDSRVLPTFTDEIVIYAQPVVNLVAPRFTPLSK